MGWESSGGRPDEVIWTAAELSQWARRRVGALAASGVSACQQCQRHGDPQSVDRSAAGTRVGQHVCLLVHDAARAGRALLAQEGDSCAQVERRGLPKGQDRVLTCSCIRWNCHCLRDGAGVVCLGFTQDKGFAEGLVDSFPSDF